MSILKDVNLNYSWPKSVYESSFTVLSDYQQKNMQQLARIIQLEQQSYLREHPEIASMLIPLLSRFVQQKSKSKDVLKEITLHFLKISNSDVHKEIREFFKLPVDKPAVSPKYEDVSPRADLIKDFIENLPKMAKELFTTEPASSNTTTSSFMSINTSDSTLQTPEFVPTPEATMSEVFSNVITKMIDKAVYSQVTEGDILYDIAYVELMKAVEDAMEIPVIEIRKDLADILNIAYRIFELKIDENKRLAEEAAWENRIRKKLKRKLRRQNNYKGYETPKMLSSAISLQAKYMKPPEVQYSYNRYPKDRFGVYLPRETEYSNESVTVPVGDDFIENDGYNNPDMELRSLRSAATKPSFASLALISLPLIKRSNNVRKSCALKRTVEKISDDLKNIPTHMVLFKP